MRELFLLVKTLRKCNGGILTTMGMPQTMIDSEIPRGQRLIQYIGLGIVAVVLMVLLGKFSLPFFTEFVADGVELLAYSGICVALTIISLFLSAQSALSLFFLSNDNETLIHMPIHPGMIAIAKALIIYRSCVIPTVIMGVPILLAGQISGDGSALSMAAAVIVPFLIPITPIFFVVIISMILMRFVRIGKSKESKASTITVIFMLLMIIVPMLFNFIQSGIQSSGGIEGALKGLSGSIYVLECIFPTIMLAVAGLQKAGVLYLIGFVVIAGLQILIYTWVAEKLFLKAVIQKSSHGGRQKCADEQSIRNYCKARHSARSACTRKERQLLFRTPVFFLQEVLLSIILIVLFGGLCLFLVIQIYPDIEVLRHEDLGDLEAYVWYGALGLILLISALSVAFTHVTGTCISREGSGLIYMKTMPVDMKVQLSVKSRIGLYLALAGAIPFLIMIDYICVSMSVNILLIPVSILLSVTVIIFGNDLQLYLDCKNPLINWETEYAAATNNHLLPSLIGPILYIVVLLGVGAILYMIFETTLIIVVGTVLLIAIAFTMFSHFWFYKAAEKCMKEL